MKKFCVLILLGLLIRHGSTDVSHLSKHVHNGYLPPQPAQNLFIEQDNNVINSPQSDNESGQSHQYNSGFDNESRGYLPPYQENSHYHNHNYHQHQHEHSQEEELGYLQPPPLKTQEQIHNHNQNEQLDTNLGYLPPVQEQSHAQEIQDIHHNHQEDREYLPPHHQEQFENHDHHHITKQLKKDTVDPNLQVSYYNSYAIAAQNNGQNHEHNKDSNRNDEYEDNSNGYNYSPPNHGFVEEGHQHHHQTGQKDSLIGGPEPAVNPVSTSQNSQKVQHLENHQTSEESHTQSNLKQNFPPNNINPDYQNEEPHQQVNQGYLPPSPLNHEHSQAYMNQAEKEDILPPSSYQIHGTHELHQADEEGYLPPIGALELPQSSDTLHIVPPSKLGLPIQKSKNQLETNHINVPLPIPQAGYYFIPSVVTKLPNLIEETKPEHHSTLSNIPPLIEGQQQQQNQHQNYQQYQQQQLSTNEIPTAVHSRPSNSGFRIIPSVQTAHEIASQGYLTPSQVVAQHLHFADIDISSSNSNHLEIGQQNFPPLIQTEQQQNQVQFVNQQLEQNLNEVQNTHQQEDHSQGSFENFVKFASNVVNNEQNQINRPLEPSSHLELNAYLPPVGDYNQKQPTFQNQNQVVCNNKQSKGEIHNQVTNLETYMDTINPNDRYGSLQFQPKHAIESNPPSLSPPLILSKPSAIEAYAPGMAYKVSTNTPFNTLTQAGYLPPSPKISTSSEENQPEYLSSIGFELNEDTKKDLAQHQNDHDNTIFPIADILDVPDDEMSQIMEQLQGHIRTIQITNHHDHSVKNIKVLDSSTQAGVRTIEILGKSNENPKGDHKVLHVISKVPNPQVIDQTIKIFNDSKEAVKPTPTTTSNEYLPPSNTDTDLRKYRRRY